MHTHVYIYTHTCVCVKLNALPIDMYIIHFNTTSTASRMLPPATVPITQHYIICLGTFAAGRNKDDWRQGEDDCV